VTVPVGSKLTIVASGSYFSGTGGTNVYIGLYDTQSSSIIYEKNYATPAQNQLFDFTVPWVLAGDGNSHTIELQFKTGNGSDGVNIRNSSSTLVPIMLFTLYPKAN
jgi:hypothetical protein